MADTKGDPQKFHTLTSQKYTFQQSTNMLCYSKHIKQESVSPVWQTKSNPKLLLVTGGWTAINK